MNLRWGWKKNAGLLHICGDGWSWALHIAVQPRHWIWGRKTEEYDMLCDYLGAGPLFLLVYNLARPLR